MLLHSQGMRCNEIEKITGLKRKNINAFFHRNGLNTSNSIYTIVSQCEINDICKMYQDGYTASEILQKYSNKIQCENTIIKIVRDNGICIRQAARFTPIEHEDFFQYIDSEEKAYVLGWMMTDGYVVYPSRKNRAPFFGITLKLEDAYMLEWFRSVIGIEKKISVNTNPILRSSGKNAVYRNEAVLIVTSRKMVADLAQYGVVPRKANKTQVPKLPDELLRHFVRGVFDGDGSAGAVNLGFCGNRDFLERILDILQNAIGFTQKKIYTKEYVCGDGRVGQTSAFYFSAKSDVQKFYHYLYDNANIYLDRKKKRIEDLLN